MMTWVQFPEPVLKKAAYTCNVSAGEAGTEGFLGLAGQSVCPRQ